MNSLANKTPFNTTLDVTPDMAAKWLEGNTHNRPLIQPHAERLARAMKAGHWQLTHQGIAFDTEGCLIDGQHRLWAIVESSVTVKMQVFFNVPAETRLTVDCGQKRSNRDILMIAGKIGTVSDKHLATLRAMLAGMASRSCPASATEETEPFQRHREAVQFAVEHFGHGPHKGLTTAHVRAVIARAYYAADRQKLTHFCDVLRTGVPTSENDHVILALRDFLTQTRKAGMNDSARRLRYAKMEWALDAFLAGKQPKRLQSSTTELFPLPEEAEVVPTTSLALAS